MLTGLAMTLTNLTRPASGAEHIISHFWEIKKLEKGQLSDFHGKKVGVATLLITRLYYNLIGKNMRFKKEDVNWEEVYAIYGPNFIDEVKKMNNPPHTAKMDPVVLAKQWPQIIEIVLQELPPFDALMALMLKAGAATTLDEIGIDPKMGENGLKYHAFMRSRINLSRLIPMMEY